MAKRAVVEVVCDRCGRIETQTADESAAHTPEIVATFQGVTIEYNDLCRRCRKTVANYISQLRREADPVEDHQAAPVEELKSQVKEESTRKGLFGLSK